MKNFPALLPSEQSPEAPPHVHLEHKTTFLLRHIPALPERASNVTAMMGQHHTLVVTFGGVLSKYNKQKRPRRAPIRLR